MKKILSLIMICGALTACAPKEIYKSKIDYDVNNVDTAEVEEYYVNGKHDKYYEGIAQYEDYPDVGRYGTYYTYQKEFKKDEFFKKSEIKTLSSTTRYNFFNIVDNNKTLTNVYYKDEETYRINELEYTSDGTTIVAGKEVYYYTLEKFYLVDLVDKNSLYKNRKFADDRYNIYILKVTYTMTFNKKIKSNKSHPAKVINTSYSTEVFELVTKTYSIDMK